MDNLKIMAEEVKNAGKMDFFELFNYLIFSSAHTTKIVVLMILAIPIIIVSCVIIYLVKEQVSTKEILIGIIIILFVLVPTYFLIKWTTIEIEANLGESIMPDWETEHVVPLIKKLETEYYELDSYQIVEPGPFENHLGCKMLHRDLDNRGQLFLYQIKGYDEDNRVKKIISCFEVFYDLEEGEVPYAEINYLPWDLGNGINKGYYNGKIYLHKNSDVK